MKKISIVIFAFIIFTVFGQIAFAQKINVSGEINQKTVKRGKTATGTIILAIPNELHINSNRPVDEFLIPTSVKFSNSNLKISNVNYPKGLLKKFPFSEKLLSVYEGKTIIKFSFNIPVKVTNKEFKVGAVIQYQACNDEVCFPPRKEKILLLAKIR